MSAAAITLFVAILTKRLTASGRGTPIIFWNFQVFQRHLMSRELRVCSFLSRRYFQPYPALFCPKRKLPYLPVFRPGRACIMMQASTCLTACSFFAHFTRFGEPTAARRRSSGTHTGEMSSTRRHSMISVSITAAQQLLQQLHPQAMRNAVIRRGSFYLRQAREQSLRDREVVGANGDRDGFRVKGTDTAGHNMRRATICCAGAGLKESGTPNVLSPINAAKVVPTQGTDDGGHACKEVTSP